MTPAQQLVFVTAVSRVDVLRERLLASPCIRERKRKLVAYFNVASAAEAFNAAMASVTSAGTWLVWVHQDVVLPEGWDERFLAALDEAQRTFPDLAVAGIYGMSGSTRAGHVLDRGNLLRESAALPCAVDSLDELLFAVRADSGLRLDPDLAFDFYGTDIVLQAQASGMRAAVVDAYCEHWSDTPAGTPIPPSMADRIVRSGRAFEAKWASRLPVHTSWLAVERPGDVERFIDSLR
ncbi:hypothetical protein [Ramlibacter albus]|uniref:Glycosyltransferase n=1 Tax=Ramlibacter albus TaxID=2079448 RepID=A0A923S1T1_9BURK|nr:hypothetical protein [Ramlibacter albus]MBC5764749.1 hypothetical protein [Ramlibacter albus]